MKIRNGFISNSSSSSFCILGIKYSKYELENRFNAKYFFKYEDWIGVSERMCASSDFTWYQGMSEISEDDIIIGKELYILERKYEDKTIPQMKENIAKEMSKKWDVEIKPSDIHFYIDSSYDG